MTDASTTGAVERFRLSYGNLLQSPSGPYVRFTDYQAAIQRAEAAEAQAARAWEAGRDAAKLRASMFGQGKQGMRTSEVIQRQIRALTPPADLSAALTARLDAEWNAAIEAATSAMDTHYADKACGMIGSHWLTRLRALRRAAPTEGEA